MAKQGALSVETIVVLVICLLVLAVSTYFVIKGSDSGNTAIDEGTLRSECMEWQRWSCDSEADHESEADYKYNDHPNIYAPNKNKDSTEETYPALYAKFGTSIDAAKEYCNCY